MHNIGMTVGRQTVVSGIWRYPIKGLAGELLAVAALAPGRGIVFDRRWLLATANVVPLLDSRDKWRPWNYGLTLKKTERLAFLQCRAADDNGAPLLSIYEKNEVRVCGHPEVPSERANIENFLQNFLQESTLQLTDCRNRAVWDERGASLTVLNNDSVADFAVTLREAVSCRRFRANIEVCGMAAGQERQGGVMRVGTVRLRLGDGVPRCAATCVNPQTATRDMNIPAQLLRECGHNEMGVEAVALTAGEIAVGMEATWQQTD